LFEGVDQLGCQPGQVNPQALDAVIEFRVDSFDTALRPPS